MGNYSRVAIVCRSVLVSGHSLGGRSIIATPKFCSASSMDFEPVRMHMNGIECIICAETCGCHENPKRAELSLSLGAVSLRLIVGQLPKKSEPASAQRLERLVARPGIVAQEALLGRSVFFPQTSTVQNSKTQISGTFIRLSYRGVYRGVATRRPQIVDHRSASGMRLHAICAICHCSEFHSGSMILGMVSSVEYPLEMCIMKRDFVKVVRTV